MITRYIGKRLQLWKVKLSRPTLILLSSSSRERVVLSRHSWQLILAFSKIPLQLSIRPSQSKLIRQQIMRMVLQVAKQVLQPTTFSLVTSNHLSPKNAVSGKTLNLNANLPFVTSPLPSPSSGNQRPTQQCKLSNHSYRARPSKICSITSPKQLS